LYHLFPRAYVPEDEVPFEKAEYLDRRNRVWVDRDRLLLSETPCRGWAVFSEVLYNRLVDVALDLIGGVFITDVVIFAPSTPSYLFIKRGTEVGIVEASGASVIPLVREGETVEEGNRVFYVITRKKEVRVIRARRRGVVVYVSDIVPSVPTKYLALIVGEELVRRLTAVSACR